MKQLSDDILPPSSAYAIMVFTPVPRGTGLENMGLTISLRMVDAFCGLHDDG
jgi:hypothetical protein